MHGTGPCLVVAGPGSGKTSVIIQHIHKLLTVDHIPSTNLLILTFTRAAANEMRRRFRKQYPDLGKDLLFGTFHAICYQILRTSDTTRTYHLITDTERYHILKKVLLELQYHSYADRNGMERILHEISRRKNTMPGQILPAESGTIPEAEPDIRRIQERYDHYMQAQGVIDYDDMVVSCFALLQDHPNVLRRWTERFSYILVDEFQDCNDYQYMVLKMLCGASGYLFAVGDDDQAIYGFRGAKPRIMQDFLQDYPGTHLVRMEENYRCGSEIVTRANQLIAHNQHRIDKHICNGNGRKGAVRILDGEDQLLTELGRSYRGSTAILLRTNHQAAMVAQLLIRKQLKCCIRNRISPFYEHFIIQDLLAYVSLCQETVRRRDFFRIMNRPDRGLVRTPVRRETFTMQELTGWYDRSCREHLRELDEMVQFAKGLDLYAAVSYLYRRSGYADFLREYAIRNRDDYEEYEQLLYLFLETIRDMKTLRDWKWFVKQVEECEKNRPEEELGQCIQVMTYHGAKGLEFDRVILPELQEGIVPHKKTTDVEEERRLFYVALTRARQEVLLLYTEDGDKKQKSRFLTEMGFLDSYSSISSNACSSSSSSNRSTAASYSSSSSMYSNSGSSLGSSGFSE